MRRPLIYLGVPVLVAVVLLLTGGVLGGHSRPAAAPVAAPTDRLADSIARAQDRLRTLPKDWRTWAALASAYVEEARVTANPTYYQKAQGAAQQSLTLHPDGNVDALVALGALANARHDFAGARDQARAALAVDGYSADAYGVLADAQTQLGDSAAATDAVQRMLDLRPGLAAYARASYDLELHGRTDDATALMRRALDAATHRVRRPAAPRGPAGRRHDAVEPRRRGRATVHRQRRRGRPGDREPGPRDRPGGRRGDRGACRVGPAPACRRDRHAGLASYAYHLGAIEAALGQRDAARADLTRALTTNPYFSPLEAPVARQLLTKVGS